MLALFVLARKVALRAKTVPQNELGGVFCNEHTYKADIYQTSESINLNNTGITAAAIRRIRP